MCVRVRVCVCVFCRFQAMLTSLDPYTEFENVELAEEMREMTIGNYAGIGMREREREREEEKRKTQREMMYWSDVC